MKKCKLCNFESDSAYDFWKNACCKECVESALKLYETLITVTRDYNHRSYRNYVNEGKKKDE